MIGSHTMDHNIVDVHISESSRGAQILHFFLAGVGLGAWEISETRVQFSLFSLAINWRGIHAQSHIRCCVTGQKIDFHGRG